MKLKYLGKYEREDLSLMSYWTEPTRYDFEIIYDDKEEKMLPTYEKEFKLNCKHQLT